MSNTITRARLNMSRREAVLLVRSPEAVALDAPGNSYIGGLPKLPPDLDWPRVQFRGEERRPTFIAQIDLAELPEFKDRNLLPKRGTLFFFGLMWGDDDDWGEASEGRVLYSAQSLDGVAPSSKPDAMHTLWPRQVGYPGSWLAPSEFCIQVAFRHSLRLHRFWSYKKGPSDTNFAEEMRDASRHLEYESIREALGSPRPVLESLARREQCATWPDRLKSWLHVQHVVNALAAAADQDIKRRRKIASESPPSAQYQNERYREIFEKARVYDIAHLKTLELVHAAAAKTLETCRRLAAGHELLSAVPHRTMQEIIQTLAEVRASCEQLFSPRSFEQLTGLGVEFASQLCATQGRTDLLPSAFLDFAEQCSGWRVIKYRDDDLDRGYPTCPKHQMFGHSQNRQNEDNSFGDHVLLFQLDAEPSLHLYPGGSGSYYFFIPRGDLRKLNFDRVTFAGSV